MTEALSFRRTVMTSADAPLWNALLAAWSEPRPLASGISFRLRVTDRPWGEDEVEVMTAADETEIPFRILNFPRTPVPIPSAARAAALPRAIREAAAEANFAALLGCLAEFFGFSEAQAWGLSRKGTFPASAYAVEDKLLLEWSDSSGLAAALLLAVEPSRALALLRAAGLDPADGTAEAVDMRLKVEPRWARMTLSLGEVADLSPGDVLLLGPSKQGFDGVRIEGDLFSCRPGPAGAVVLDDLR